MSKLLDMGMSDYDLWKTAMPDDEKLVECECNLCGEVFEFQMWKPGDTIPMTCDDCEVRNG